MHEVIISIACMYHVRARNRVACIVHCSGVGLELGIRGLGGHYGT